MNKPLNIRVPERLRSRIDELYERRGFQNRSEFVREVLRDAVEADRELTEAATGGIDPSEVEPEYSLAEVKADLQREQVRAVAEESFDGPPARVTMGEAVELGAVTTVVESDIGYMQSDGEDLDILIVGCGGGGVRITSQIHRQGHDTYRTAILDTDLDRLNEGEANLRALVGKQRFDGNGSDGDVAGVRESIDQSTELLDQILREPDLVFVTTGLGGGTGTALAPRIAEQAHKQGAVTVSLATLPFERNAPVATRAQDGLERLDKASDTLAVLDGKRVAADPGLSFSEALTQMNTDIAHLVSQLCVNTGNFYFSSESASLLQRLRDGGRSVLLNSVIDVSQNESYDELSDRLLQYTNVDVTTTRAKQAILTFTAGEGIGDASDHIDDIVSSMRDRADGVAWGSRQLSRSAETREYTIRMTGLLTGLDMDRSDFFSRDAESVETTEESQIEILPASPSHGSQSVA